MSSYNDDYLGNSFDKETGEFNLNRLKNVVASRKEKISILLMGATGVGKSSLVNAIFGDNIVESGVGKPITQHLEKIEIPKKGLILWDTKGIESKDYENNKEQLITDIETGISKAVQLGSKEEIPAVAWLCIKESSSRIEDRELDLLRLARDRSIPTVVVFTNTQDTEQNNAFFEKAKAELNKEFSVFLQNRYVRVNTVEYKFLSVLVPKSGLEDLLIETEKCWEQEGKSMLKQIFLKAQQVNNEKRLMAMKESAKNKVHIAAAAAGTAGLSPIPFSDAPIISAIQTTMVYTINSEFEVEKEDSYMTTVAAGILASSLATSIGKTTVTSILKFIPGFGTVVGGTISGAVSAAITEAIGQAYIKILENCFDMETGKVILPENSQFLLEMFKNTYKAPK